MPAVVLSWTRRITSHIPPGQVLRYLVVGGWNTLFGYACFSVLTALLDRVLKHGYIIASVLASLINITVTFFGYKWFVFKTRGNYLREWLRVVGVYSTSILIGAALLPVLVFFIHHISHWDRAAPYVAGALLTMCSMMYSFLAHKQFSFRANPKGP
jgi:putative flippase GtrA